MTSDVLSIIIKKKKAKADLAIRIYIHTHIILSFCVVPLKSILFFEKGHSQLKFHKKFYKTLGSRPLFRDFLFAKFHSLKTRFHRITHFAHNIAGFRNGLEF